jgi:hypothetical protein
MSEAPSGGASDRHKHQDNRDSPESTRSPRRPQLRCAGCGTAGRLSLADPDPADQQPVLAIAWNWHADGKPAMVCSACATAAAAERQTGRQS